MLRAGTGRPFPVASPTLLQLDFRMERQSWGLLTSFALSGYCPCKCTDSSSRVGQRSSPQAAFTNRVMADDPDSTVFRDRRDRDEGDPNVEGGRRRAEVARTRRWGSQANGEG